MRLRFIAVGSGFEVAVDVDESRAISSRLMLEMQSTL
jgi:hypothetical protein